MFPNKVQAVGITLTLIALQLFISILLSLAGVEWELGDPLVYILIAVSSCAIIVNAVLPRMQLRFVDLFHAHFNNLPQLLSTTFLPIVLMTLGLHVLLSNLANIYYHFFPSETIFTQSLEAMVQSGFFGLIAICLVAPVMEEILYRGIILRGLLANYSRRDALFTSAVLFSLVHLNPDQLLHTLILGYFFGWLYIHSYSLWTPIVAHILFNTTAYFMALGTLEIEGINAFPENEFAFAGLHIQLLGLVFLVIGAFSLVNVLVKSQR